MENNDNIKRIVILIFSFWLIVGFLLVFIIGVQNQNEDKWINIYNKKMKICITIQVK